MHHFIVSHTHVGFPLLWICCSSCPFKFKVAKRVNVYYLDSWSISKSSIKMHACFIRVILYSDDWPRLDRSLFSCPCGWQTGCPFGYLPGIQVPGSYFYTQVMGFAILQVRWSEWLACAKVLSEKAKWGSVGQWETEGEGQGTVFSLVPAVPLAKPVCVSVLWGQMKCNVGFTLVTVRPFRSSLIHMHDTKKGIHFV